MHSRASIKTVLLVLCFMIFGVLSAHGGVPDVAHVMVTDVTTVSFSVIWASSEASTADLKVYYDADGINEVTEAVITPHPVESGDLSIKTAAEDKGVMKARVTGLSAATTYYFETITTSKSTADTVYSPAAAPFRSVTTEVRTVRSYNSNGDELPFSNDIIVEPCYLEDGIEHATGTLLIAILETGDKPLTAFVGDGIESPYALIDLNNAFSRETKEAVDCSQGEDLTLLNFRGIKGYSIVTHNVPEDNSMSEVKPGENYLKPGWNMVAFQIEPTNSDIAEIIDSLGATIDAAWAYDAANNRYLTMDKNIPEFWWDLTEIHSTTGYWFVMNEYSSLKINGSISVNFTQLYPGWNLVGSKSMYVRDIEDATSHISDKLESIWHYDAGEEDYLSYDKNIPPYWNSLFTLEPGKAYWFVMNENCIGEACQW